MEQTLYLQYKGQFVKDVEIIRDVRIIKIAKLHA